MQHSFLKISLLLCSLCTFNAFSQNEFSWQEHSYNSFFVDFNHDGIADLLLQSLNEIDPSLLITGEMVNEQLQYLEINQQTLPSLISQYPWSSENAKLIVADFNGDEMNDILFVFSSVNQAVTYLGTEQGLNFSAPANITYGEDDLKWLKKERDFDFYPGDFNGDGKSDLLALSLDKHQHFLMHSDDDGVLSVVQKIKKKVKWGKKRTEKLMIGDYNNDGRDDVLALPKKANKPHFLVLSNKNGKLKKAKKLKDTLQNKNWNAEDFTILAGFADEDETLDFVRLNNMPGGIDENDEEHDSEADEDVDDTENQCDQLFMSASGAEGSTCSPWTNNEANTPHAQKIDANLTSFAQAKLKKAKNNAYAPCDILFSAQRNVNALPGGGDTCYQIPATPTSYPGIVGGSYHPVGSTITVAVSPILNAIYYQIYVSNTNSNYSNIATFTGTSRNITIRNSWGYEYIKYKACNISGCSGLSPWRRIHAYDSPYRAAPSASPSTITSGKNATITFPNPGHILWVGTHYERKYLTPSGSSISMSNLGHTSGNTQTSFSTPTLTQLGRYTFYVRACNPSLPCGAWGQTTLTVNSDHPLNSPTISPSGGTYVGSRNVSISAPGTTIHYKINNGNYQTYSSYITISSTSTVSAYATKDYWPKSTVSSATITIKANEKPTVSPTDPTDNAIYLTTETVTAAASANDSDGSITQVEFKLDNGTWNTDTSADYTHKFSNLSVGGHTISYRAKDNSGAYSAIPSRYITVKLPENIKPTVSPTAPTNNAIYLASETVNATASANDSGGSITQVEFKLDNGTWNIDNNYPYTYEFSGLSTGNHIIYYRAKDNSGAYSAIPSRYITVKLPENIKPTVSPTAPTNNAIYLASETVTATASANDSDGNITQVEFKLDNGAWNTDTLANYSHEFSNLSVGNHIIHYRAKDNNNDYSTELIRTITINNTQTPVNVATPTAPTLKTVPAATGQTIGTMPGAFKVDESGAATYSVPLSVPQGIAGVTPSVSLNYSSASGNGTLGMGWNVSAVSAIGRCRQTDEQDGSNAPITLTNEDRFCLDGQKLIAVSGAYGEANTEYRTEIDSQTRIISYGTSGTGPGYFTVEHSDGSTSYYGNTDQSNAARTDSVLKATDETIINWFITSTSDNLKNDDNTIIFNYHNGGAGYGDHEIVIDNITYSGNTVDFIYRNDSDSNFERSAKPFGYLYGERISSKALLDEVVIYNHNDSAINSYHLNYETDAKTNIYRINSIQQCNGSQRQYTG